MFCHPGEVRTEFMMSVLHAAKPGGPISQVKDHAAGPVLTIARSDMARDFMKTDCDWLWFVDTDMVFTPRTLPALLKWADPVQRPVVGALCMAIANKELRPTMYLVQREPSFGFAPCDPDGYPKDKLVRVDATGCACLLIHRTVFDRLTKQNPDDENLWFTEMVVDGVALGEDLSFSLRLAMAEIPLFVHTGIKVGHIKPIKLGDVSP